MTACTTESCTSESARDVQHPRDDRTNPADRPPLGGEQAASTAKRMAAVDRRCGTPRPGGAAEKPRWSSAHTPSQGGVRGTSLYPGLVRALRSLRSGNGTETAIASGNSCGTSSTMKSRNPTTLSALAIDCGALPHSGQATTYAAAAALKRKRQSGQQTWFIADPFRSKPGVASSHGRSRTSKRFARRSSSLLVAVATADRLSALLSGNVAPKARRAGLTERSASLARRPPLIR